MSATFTLRQNAHAVWLSAVGVCVAVKLLARAVDSATGVRR